MPSRSTTGSGQHSLSNGAETFTWPDGGTTPFRGEKGTNWEGGYRVPTAIRWPVTIEPGTVDNGIFAHEDMLPTLLAAAGAPDVKEKLLTGYSAGNTTYKVHLDGYDLAPYFKGGTGESPRHEFLYWNDDGKLVSPALAALVAGDISGSYADGNGLMRFYGDRAEVDRVRAAMVRAFPAGLDQASRVRDTAAVPRVQ